MRRRTSFASRRRPRHSKPRVRGSIGAGAGRIQRRGQERAEQRICFGYQNCRRPSAHRRVNGGAFGHGDEQAVERRSPAAAAAGRQHRRARRRDLGLPEQTGNLLKRRALGQRDSVETAIPKASARHRRNRGSKDGIAPADRLCGHRLRRSPTGPPFGQTRNVGAVIETAARVARIGLGANSAAADIGIERLRANAEELERLLGGQPFHRGIDVDRFHQG